MNLQDLRNYIRMQLDMDDEELPNPMLDAYLDEAFQRTISIDHRWPSYQVSTTIVKADDATNEVDIPAGIDPPGITTVIDGQQRLVQISNEQAEDSLAAWATSSTPMYYSIWGNKIRLWPNPSGERTLSVRAYRYPTDWISQGAGAVPDCDERLHIILAHYAIGLAYAQQEDEVLEATYMKRWQSSLLSAHDAICNPRHHRPLILNGGLPIVSYPGSPVAWANPPVSP